MARSLPHLFSRAGDSAIDALLRQRPLLAFDFDGTLTPIVDKPDDVRLSTAVADDLRRLARWLPVAIVSGRSVHDLRPRLGFEPSFVMGSHGAEDESTPEATADRMRRLDPCRRQLDLQAAALAAAGVRVEDKGVSLALHYRQAADPLRARAAIDALLHKLPPGLQQFGGKAVLNLLARGAPDKADALRELVARSGCTAALFAGDDVNDEPVFEQAPANWLTVHVGAADADTRARFLVDSPQQMAQLLQQLCARLDDAPSA